MRLTPIVVVAACLSALASCLMGQEPAARARLDSLWTAAQVPGASLDALRSDWQSRTTGSEKRLGLDLLALQANDRAAPPKPLVDTWDDLGRLVRTRPNWPWARFALGMAALNLYRTGAPVPADYEGSIGGTHYDGFVVEVKRLYQIDPGFAPAARWIADMAVGDGDREQSTPVLALLSWLVDTLKVPAASSQLVLARAARLQQEYDLSLKRLDAYAQAGGDRSILGLERARTLAALHRLDDAAAAYREGLHHLSVAGREEYRADLSWVARKREMARLDSLALDSLDAFINGFWSLRDAQELRDEGERLQEHLRRWVYVHGRFRIPDPDRRTLFARAYAAMPDVPCMETGAQSLDDLDYVEPARIGRYRVRERVLDHRAIIYMRHGEPYFQYAGFQSPDLANVDDGGPLIDAAPEVMSMGGLPQLRPASGDGERGGARRAARFISTFKGGLPKTLSWLTATWVYYINGMPRVYNFYAQSDKNASGLGSQAPTTLLLNTSTNLTALLHLEGSVPELVRLAGMLEVYRADSTPAMPVYCQPVYREAIRELRRDAAVALETDTYLRRMREPVTTAAQLYTLGQGNDARLLLAVAVPAEQLRADTIVNSSDLFRMRIETAILDTLAGRATRTDTTVTRLVTHDTERKGWMTALVTLPVATGASEARIAVLQGSDDRGAILTAVVNPPAAPGFALSDLVLGRPGGSPTWHTQGQEVPVSAFGSVAPGSTVSVYYELYGGTPGGEVRTSLTLQAAKKDAVSLRFDDVVSRETMGFTRLLGLEKVKPGTYTLTLSVEDRSTGRTTSRSRQISIRK